MANDGQIVFEVTADGKKAIANIKDITKAIQQETGKWDDAAEQSAGNINNQFSGMLKKLVAGFSAAKIGHALLNIGKEAIQAASDLQEVQNVVDVTFGANSNKIEAWAAKAGTQFGLTETQAKKFTSTLGAMMKSSGLAGSEIVDMSTDLAGLAADMASFYNLDFDEAFQKIRSGISGETEPLKQLGINMSVANMEAFALSQGIEKAWDKMSQGEQTLLRYQYLMSATADAQGDFARTSDDYANGIRTLETNLESFKTNIGDVILPWVNEIVGGINSLFKDRSGEPTVLDSFAEIDEETARKIAKIQATADEARILVDELTRLGSTNLENAGSNVQQFATDLSSIDLEQGKAGVVKEFVSVLANNIGILSSVQGTDADGAKEWLDGIAASANKLDSDDAEGWQTLIETIKTGLPGFENTDFGAKFFAALGEGFTDVEKKSSLLEWAVDTLGNKTNRTAEQQAMWLEICKQLVKTIPGLSSVINTETGEVKGGTQAIKDYIKAWEDGQTKLALLGAHEQKGNILAQAFEDLPNLRLKMIVASHKIKKEFDKVRHLYEQYGLQLGYDSNGKVDRTGFAAATGADRTDLDAFADVMDAGLAADYVAASDAYNARAEEYEIAKEAYAEEGEALSEMPGTINEVVDATEAWIKSTGKEEQQIIDLVNAAQLATSEMEDYAKGVHDAMLEAVNSVAKSLDEVDYQAYGDLIEKRKKLSEQQLNLDKESDQYKEIQKEIDEINNSLMTRSKIMSNMESQETFLDSYLANIKKAREMGLSEELLAELSDGSIESAEYLDALVNGEEFFNIDEFNEKYAEIQGKKEELAKELGNQQLAVDETYKALAEKAAEAVAALDLGEEAKNNAGNTIAEMAQGIADHLPDVQNAVNGIIAALDRLNGYGINIDFGGFGNINITTSTGKTEGSGRFGLEYVPHDDYIARLHEGERVLTAQENQIWNALRNGGIAGFDMDTLGGVMRDNVKPGGNVYLDGRVVGSVISDMQGKSYRQLQRSGWQG